MYKFIKLKDEDNEFSVSDIEFSIDTVNRDVLLDEFMHFLKACGFYTKDLEE